MEQNRDQTSAKPVSSLKSHFEALTITPSNRELDHGKATPNSLRPADNVPSIRASFDISRPSSPWLGNSDDGKGKRDDSPAKPGHRRPLSVFSQLLPSLTSNGHLDSPRSPFTATLTRNTSRSPERDSNPNGRVQGLTSQPASRASSRPTTPRSDAPTDTFLQPPRKSSIHSSTSQEQLVQATKPPPPVNRGRKPDIPSKPTTLAGNAGQEKLKPGSDTIATTFPFHSPAGSTGSRSPSPTHRELDIRPVKNRMAPPPPKPRNSSTRREKPDEASLSSTPIPRRLSTQKDSAEYLAPVPFMNQAPAPPPPRTSDARLGGFSKPPVPTERKDPRSFGFGGVPSVSQTREMVADQPNVSATAPARANTVADRPSTRDARDLGFSHPKVTPRHVSENVTSSPVQSTVKVINPPSGQSASQQNKNVGVRDARQFGFSSTSTNTKSNETEISAPQPRRNLPPGAPLPRASQEMARPTTRQIPAHSLPDKVLPSQSLADQQLRSNTLPDDLPDRHPRTGVATSRSSTPTVDPKFLPPPKRYTEAQKTSLGAKTGDDSDSAEDDDLEDNLTVKNDYPDMTKANRRPPHFPGDVHEVHTKSDARVFDIWENYLCITGHITRVFDFTTGEQLMSLTHQESMKMVSAIFKPASDTGEEGLKLWLGNGQGELQEIDVNTTSVSASSQVHTKSIVQMVRYRNNVWTMDEDGSLCVWKANETGVPNLKYRPVSHKVHKGHTFSIVIHDQLWHATGKEIRIYRPGNEATFQITDKPLGQPNSGDVTSGAFTTQNGGQVLFGHTDGKISVYSTKDHSYITRIQASDYKISAMLFVGDWLWTAFRTGKVYVYDTSTTPWTVKKDWPAHNGPISGLVIDPSSVWRNATMRVVTIGHDNYARAWDGMLEGDWLEEEMQRRDADYCSFREVRAAILTWNAGAITPSSALSDFIADAIHADEPPELFVFGFQEVVDLEDSSVTAKSFFGFGRKKDPASNDQYQSRVYREWRDYLYKVINQYCSVHYSYSDLATSSLVGLFQCIFIRQEEKPNIQNLRTGEVKCGIQIGSKRQGNKGALITRFTWDDTSLCFVNCHLAAGQKHTRHRNNDVFSIMEAEPLSAEHDPDIRSATYVMGGDGTQILDHEICILNGDLNYRIDHLSRDTIIGLISQRNYARLLDSDQLLQSRKRVSGFRLNGFTELQINFAPTYKYDVGADRYDTSEKKRAPAWCDRILYRGPWGSAGPVRIRQVEYKRHECDASDHRPVSGLFKIKIKTVDQKRRSKTKRECSESFAAVKKRLVEQASIAYLMNDFGISESEARKELRRS